MRRSFIHLPQLAGLIVVMALSAGCREEPVVAPPPTRPLVPWGPEVLWEKWYDGTMWNYPRSVTATTDGGFMIGCIGSTSDTSNGLNLLKIDRDGNEQWQRVYPEPYNSSSWVVAATPDGGAIAAGYGRYTLVLVKVDASGEKQWSRVYDGDRGEYRPASIVVDPAGNYVITGRGEGHNYGDMFVRKIAADGEPLWLREFGGEGVDDGWKVILGSDGGYVVSGSLTEGDLTAVPGEGETAYLIKFDAGGNTVWERKIHIPYINQSGKSVAATPDGGYIVSAGQEAMYDTTGGMCIVKLDRNGEEQWRSNYYRIWAPARPLLSGVRGTYVAMADGCLHGIGTSGEMLWKRPMAGANYEVSDVVLDSNGDYLVVGGGTGYRPTQTKVYVARVARE